MQYVGAVVGGVIGFYVGGVEGAVYGAQLGYGIGAVIESSNSKIVTEGPRLSDLKVTISANGAFIPRVFVFVGGMGGNIIDSTDLQPTTKDVEQQSADGKGGPTQVSRQTTYSASFLVQVCKSLGTHDVQWIKANGNLIFSRHPDADALTLINTQNVVGSVMVYDGNGTQLPDPTLEAIHGVGNVPAYRGRLTVMFKDFQLEKFSNNIASTQLTFGVVENPIEGGNEKPLLMAPNGGYAMLDEAGLWYVAISNAHIDSRTSYTGMVYLDVLDGSGPQPKGIFQTAEAKHPNLESFTVPGQPCAEYRFFLTPDNDFNGEAVSTKGATVWRFASGFHIQHDQFPIYDSGGHVIGYCDGQTLIDDGDSHARFFSLLGVAVGDLVIDGVQAFRATYPQIVFGVPQGSIKHGWDLSRNIAATDGANFAWCETISMSNVGHSYFTIKVGGFAMTETLPTSRIAGMLLSDGVAYLLLEGNYSAGSYRYDLRVIDVAANTDHLYTGGLWAYGGSRSIRLFLTGTTLQVVDSGTLRMSWADDGTFTSGDLISNPTGGGHGAPGSETRTLKWQDENFYITSFHSGVASGSPEEQVYVYSNSIAGTPQPLRVTIQKLHDEVGLPNYDFTLLPDSVLNPGYCVTRQASARVAIDFLRDLFRVDTAESGDKIKYVLRGRDAVRTLTLDELGAVEGDVSSGDPPQAIEWTLPDEYGQPRAVNLKYTAIDSAFETGTAIARRETTPSEEVVSLDATAMMLTGDAAARLAEQALVDHAAAGETSKIATTYAHEDLETADPIIVPGKFKNRRVRITGKADKGGVVEWSLMRDDASSLEQFVVGGAATSKGTQSSISVEPVSFADFLNLPSLRPQDDDPGGYVFVSSTAPSRAKGATAYDQVPDAARTIGSVVGREGVKGITTGILGTFGGVGYDSGSFVDVQFPAGTALESTTPAMMQSQGRNIFLVGGEIVGVVTTTSLGGDVWRLHGGLLRGLRGTEVAVGTHVSGETVYWLTLSGLLRDKLAVAGPVAVAAIAAGRSTTDLKKYATTATNLGQAQIPFAPFVFVCAKGAGETPVLFKWKRRSRKIQSDPFNVPVDDALSVFNYPAGTLFYQIQKSASADFSSFATINVESESAAYPRSQRYRDYLGGDDPLAPFYARVAQIGPDTKPGKFSETIYMADLPPLEFPYAPDNYFFVAPDGTTSLPGITFGGAAHVVGNRASFSGGSDIVSLAAVGTFYQGFGIAAWAFRFKFKTSSAAEQTIVYYGDPTAKGGLKLTILAGVLSFWFGDYLNGSIALITSPTGINFADGIEHVVDVFSLSAGLFNAFGMKVDLQSVGGRAFNNSQGGIQYGPTYLGNDPTHSGEAFVGTIGDFQAIHNTG